ncbi:hypothetical protein [Spirosoma sp.]|uniref:hypothetical protein n=1 Tax=Spirosoma sp. TaxID=1899569 RepID=UPI002636E827|nr:hypothetical protein [Spirosoma sp.]MCX6212907.1 hypothetical protein [Spirosoma sp.]
MTYRLISLWAVCLGLLTGCESGIREIDFESKQFTATSTINSTAHADTASLTHLMDSKPIYSFSKGGKGINHIRIGMVSKNKPFTWKMKGDSLRINNESYAVQKQNQGFVLRSDSIQIILSQQP